MLALLLSPYEFYRSLSFFWASPLLCPSLVIPLESSVTLSHY